LIFGRTFQLPFETNVKDYSIFYIGSESITLTNLMMNFNQCKFFSYNPKTSEFRQETLNVNRALMRRYYLVQKAKDAETIGIIVGTLGVAYYLEIIEHLKKIIKVAEKKYYTFLVGKINVAKLANFPEIDIFVIVACPENSLLESSEFYKPIINPFELEIAFVRGKEWSGEYISDFSKLLPGMTQEVKKEEEDNGIQEEEETRYSLITGSMKRNPKLSSHTSDPSENQLANRTLLKYIKPKKAFLDKPGKKSNGIFCIFIKNSK